MLAGQILDMEKQISKSPQSFRVMALLVILLLACALIFWHAFDNYQTIKQNTEAQSKRSLELAAEEIDRYLRKLKQNLSILATSKLEQITVLLDNPLNLQAKNTLIAEIKQIYPNLHSFMIVDHEGNLVLEDNEGLLGKKCRANIKRFSETDISNPTQIHSNKYGSHYDIILNISLKDKRTVIVFFSFAPTGIAKILNANQFSGSEIIILNTNTPNIIEISNKGINNNKLEEISNSAAEQIQDRLPIKGTLWELVVLQRENLQIAGVWTTALWAFSLLLLLGSTALWFLRRTDAFVYTQSNQLKREQRRSNLLQQTTISSELSFHEKVRALLIMGLDEFNMEVAILSRVEADTYSIVTAVSPGNGLQPGMSFSLVNTYCRHTFTADQPIGVENVDIELNLNHPGYDNNRFRSYIGTAVYVRGKVYGTLNFSSSKNYQAKFTHEDFRFLQLMTQWIGLEIERREYEQQLQTKNQLLESISRAQSYFISDNVQPDTMFDQILSDLLSLSYSNIGFITEVIYNEENTEYLKIRAIGQRYDSGDELMSFIEEMIRNTEIYNHNNVFSEVMKNGAPIISNNLEDDRRLGTLSDGAAPLNNFIGVPLYHGTQLVGMFGLANSPDGYHESFLYTLAPLATATANLIWAMRNEQQRIHTQRALHDSEEQLKLALEGANDGLWDWNIVTNTAYYSPRWQTMLNYEPGEVPATIEAKEKMIHPEDFKRVKTTVQNHLLGNSPIYQAEYRVRTKTRAWVWVLDRGKVVEHTEAGQPQRMVGTYTDITDLKEAEKALRERETRIGAILETAVDGIITISELGIIETFNPAAEKIFKYSADQIMGKNVSVLMGAEDREHHDGYINQYLSTSKANILGQRREVTGQRADGTTFPMQLAVSEMYLGDRRHFTGIVRDITQTKEADVLLQDTMALKQGILDSAKLSIISTDANGIIQTYNAAAQQLLGYREKEIIGKVTPEIFHDRDEIVQRSIMLNEELGQNIVPGFEAFVAKARIGIADEQNWTYVNKEGKRFPVILTMTALHNNDGNIIGFVAIARDMSLQQKTEEEISRFKTTLDMTLDCVFMFSPDSLRYFYANQGAMEQVGYSYNELLRMTPVDLIPEFDVTSFRELLNPMIDGKRNAVTFETFNRHRTGNLIPVEIFIQYIYPVDQEPRFVVIVRDITERKRAAESLALAEERSRLLLESAGEGIFGLDLDGRTTFVNPAAARMLGYEPPELIGQFIHEYIQHSFLDGSRYPYEFSPTYAAINQAIIQRVSNEVMHRKDASVFPVEYTVTPIRKNDNTAGAVVIFNDITERKKVEQIKNEFISTVSHELRTPLTSVRGSLGLLVGGAGGELTEQAGNLINIANKNTERLLLLINDILDIEKIEYGKLDYNYKLIDIQEFIEMAIQANNAYGEQFDVKYNMTQCPDEIKVYADEDRLMQVMNNLLSNAAKFSDDAQHVEISAVQRVNKIRISITDNGKGIPQTFQKHIFEKFAQADASDTKQLGGTGLGLSITKAIVEQHGGRIDFISRKNLGTTFFFDLPVWTQDSDQTPPKFSGTSKYRILICEEDADVAYMLRIILAQAGFDADIARTVEQATMLIQDNHYLAVTLDLSLPDEQGRQYDPDGVKLIRLLRKQDRTRELPIIVVTATASQSKRRLTTGAFGIIDWLDKPLDEEKLLSAVQHIATTKQGLPRILHVEDDPIIYEMVRVLLRGEVDLVLAPSLYDAQRLLRDEVFDLILLDIELTDGSGLELIDNIDDIELMPEIIIFSAHEVSTDVAAKVKAALIKTKDNRKELVDAIMSIIKDSEPNDPHHDQDSPSQQTH